MAMTQQTLVKYNHDYGTTYSKYHCQFFWHSLRYSAEVRIKNTFSSHILLILLNGCYKLHYNLFIMPMNGTKKSRNATMKWRNGIR
jgi:hypothetical protein